MKKMTMNAIVLFVVTPILTRDQESSGYNALYAKNGHIQNAPLMKIARHILAQIAFLIFLTQANNKNNITL